MSLMPGSASMCSTNSRIPVFDVCEKLLLGLHVFNVFPDVEVGFDDDGQQEVLDEDKDHQHVQERVDL
eukprot:2914814-Rhodomonas_salina.2